MKKILFVLCAAAAVTLSSGCANNGSEYTTLRRQFYSMDTLATLSISGKTSDGAFNEKINSLCDEVERVLSGIENSVSAHITTSAINKFNQAEKGETVEIDKVSYELLTSALNIYKMTDGCYNPSVFYSVYDYGFYGLDRFTVPESLPSDETVEKYVSLSAHFGDIMLSEKDGKYYAKKPIDTVEANGKTLSLKIDLGGIGKGYAADKVNLLIDDYGFEYGFFDFASSSIAVKKHFESVEYTFKFTDPRASGGAYFTTKVADSLVSTSGDYENYYELGGVRYCHIIDPKTGKPTRKGIMTATIIGGSATENDALTTAIMCMDKDGAVKFISEKLTDRQVTFTYDNGGNYEVYTNIPANAYSVTNGKYSVKEIK